MAGINLTTYLVTYDVNTETRKGRRRLARAAKTCLDYGQRVQNSVYECQLGISRFEELAARLKDTINPETDSVRIYRLPSDREQALIVHGLDHHRDFEGTLVL